VTYRNGDCSERNRKALIPSQLFKWKICSPPEKKGAREAGNSRYAIENKRRKNVRIEPFHDVHENK
jgi:hypothetical protein